MIAAKMPGIGDPRKLDIREYNEYLARLGAVTRLTNPMGISGRDLLEIEEGLY